MRYAEADGEFAKAFVAVFAAAAVTEGMELKQADCVVYLRKNDSKNGRNVGDINLCFSVGVRTSSQKIGCYQHDLRLHSELPYHHHGDNSSRVR